jgi:hypothetical protein
MPKPLLNGVLDIAGLNFDKVGMEVPSIIGREGSVTRTAIYRADAVFYVAPGAFASSSARRQCRWTLGLDGTG